MPNQFILDQLKDVPEIIESSIEMFEANQPVKIFEGHFILKKAETEFTVYGHIQYDWFPITGANFYGIIEGTSSVNIRFLNSSTFFDVIVNGNNIGQGIIVSAAIDNEFKIKGCFRFESITGDKSIAVEKAKFCIPNFQDYLGGSVKKISDINIGVAQNRLVLENDKYIIIIDKCIDYKQKYNSLSEKGGYIITHVGEIIPKKGNLTYQKVDEILDCLNTFLSFINGKRTSAFFIQGICENEVVWCNYSNYHVDMHNFLPSWSIENNVNCITKIWSNFSEKWSNNGFNDFIKTAVHWYLESNKGSGFVEGSIIMAQTALELLYNWYIVENKKLLIGKDSENISAANKIRLLISQLNISTDVPIKFSSLQSYLKSEKLIDAPEALVQIRNSIVHSQEEKRKKLREINLNSKLEALQLCIWYIELALLKILNYNDVYTNRCSIHLNSKGKIENIPW